MKTFYATSVMTEVTIHGHAPPTYVGSAKSKVIHFGSAQTQEPWWPREMKSKIDKRLHFKMEDNKAKPMMESIRATLSTTTSLPPLPRLQDGDKMVEHGIFPSTKVASIDDAIPIGGEPSDEAEHGMFPSTKEAIYDTSDGDESVDANLTAFIFGGDMVENGEHGIFPSPMEAYGVEHTEHNPMCD